MYSHAALEARGLDVLLVLGIVSEVVRQVHDHLPLAERVDSALHPAVEDVGRADVAALVLVRVGVHVAVPAETEAELGRLFRGNRMRLHPLGRAADASYLLTSHHG